jgi:hypothetical protein
MDISYIPASMYTLEQDEEEEQSDATTVIDEMDIDTLKANFASIMATVVQTYGDDKE